MSVTARVYESIYTYNASSADPSTLLLICTGTPSTRYTPEKTYAQCVERTTSGPPFLLVATPIPIQHTGIISTSVAHEVGIPEQFLVLASMCSRL